MIFTRPQNKAEQHILAQLFQTNLKKITSFLRPHWQKQIK